MTPRSATSNPVIRLFRMQSPPGHRLIRTSGYCDSPSVSRELNSGRRFSRRWRSCIVSILTNRSRGPSIPHPNTLEREEERSSGFDVLRRSCVKFRWYREGHHLAAPSV
jgi:hypothetical protein